MAYKYINASLPMTSKTPKENYIELFQESLNQQFYNSSDWWTIQEEEPIASKIYSNTDVRINHVINAETGVKLGDDWKTILFKEIDHNVRLGRLYSFDDNIWITINTEYIKNLTATATIKRCNNVLKWINQDTGAIYMEPCSIEYLIKEPRDYATAGSALVTPSGYIQIKVQFNERTNTIKPNQRFLFGNQNNWIAYKLVGTGANNFNNLITADNMSSGILQLEAVANYVNYETDDLVNGIADRGQNKYTITINQHNISGAIGATIPLSAVVTLNNDVVTRQIVWSSSDITVATVSASGVVTMVDIGTAVITAVIKDNGTSDTSNVNVVALPVVNTKVVISPSTNFVLEKDTVNYSVFLYKDEVVQPDTFTIVCTPNTVPTSNFVFTVVDGNHFTIQNIEKSLYGPLTVTCTSGLEIASIEIYMKGAY